MAKIHLLDRQVAELIAAGEVVERPASIAKELIENAVDAGARAVTVELRGGGIRYLRVTDNGGGIGREDVRCAFLRHATSKVREQADLGQIMTMGFRGEALASIAAMSKVELLTRTAQDAAGTRYRIAGGDEQLLEDAGCPIGTTIVVEDVFYNTPARMKFLKKDVTEANSVAAVLEKQALANPDIAFKFVRDGVVKMQTPGDGRLLSAVRCLMGKEFAEGCIEADYQLETLHLTGLVCKPEVARASRTMQNFFINGRYVRSKTCMAALEEAFKGLMMVGRYPSCVLNLQIPPQTVDVNVHPAKIEVRFADEKSIFSLVYYGCKTALGRHVLAPELRSKAPDYSPLAARISLEPQGEQTRLGAPVPARVQKPAHTSPPLLTSGPIARMSANEYKALMMREMGIAVPVEQDAILESPAFDPIASGASKPNARSVAVLERALEVSKAQQAKRVHEDAEMDSAWPATLTIEETPTVMAPPPEPEEEGQAALYTDVRLVGELFQTYILLESDEQLLVVDKHAAHERLLYTQLLEECAQSERQLLLTPVSVHLTLEEYAVVSEQLPLLERAGIEADHLGDGFLVVRAVAPVLSGADVEQLVAECVQKLMRSGRVTDSSYLEELCHTMACRAAIKAGSKTPAPALEQLVRMLREDAAATHCPHGRPVTIRITKHELDKKFGRLG